MHLRKEIGTSLIEVMVTVLVLSTSLLALAALQARSLQFNQGSYIRSQANIYAYDILDRIRLNKANLGSYNVVPAAFDLTSTAVTTPTAAADIDDWRRKIATNFAQGQGSISCVPATGVCTITIVWNELNSSSPDNHTDDKSTFVYAARI